MKSYEESKRANEESKRANEEQNQTIQGLKEGIEALEENLTSLKSIQERFGCVECQAAGRPFVNNKLHCDGCVGNM